MLVMILACSQEEVKNTDTQEPQDIVDTAQEDTSIEEIDTAEEEIECAPLDCTVSWNEESIDLSFITFDDQGSYFFGMAQTGIDNPNVWTGEDCFMGYNVEENTFSYCHPARDGIELQYGASFNEVVEGFSTHFAGPQFEPQITYIIKESISGCCWSWGEDPNYYQELGCNPLTDSE